MYRQSFYRLALITVIAGIVVTVAGQAYRAVSAGNERERHAATTERPMDGSICTVCGPIRASAPAQNAARLLVPKQPANPVWESAAAR